MERLTRVDFTNLDKMLYPKDGLKKLDVVKYYIQVAPRMLPFLRNRALVLTRFPDGIGLEGFYEKDAPKGTPEWVKKYRTYSESAHRYLDYVVCDDIDTLLWLANLAVIEFHIPLSQIDYPDKPNLVLFDLDPQLPAGFKEAVIVAKLIRQKLFDRGVKCFVKTSGKRGLHIVVHIRRDHIFEETRSWAHSIGIELAKETELVSSEKKLVKIPGKIYIDYPQNGHSRTMACPFSLRAIQGASVSTPLNWDKLGESKPPELNLKTVPARQEAWADFWDDPQKLG